MYSGGFENNTFEENPIRFHHKATIIIAILVVAFVFEDFSFVQQTFST